MGVEWLIIDNDWFSGAMSLARGDSEGRLFWKTVAYKDIDKVNDFKFTQDVYDAVGLGSYQKNPEHHGYRFGGPLIPDAKTVPPDVLITQPDSVVPKLLVKLQ